MSEFALFAEHPEFRLGKGANRDVRMEHAFDFARPEIREFKLRMIREIAETQDIDGLELDFMRHWALFHPERTDFPERLRLTTGFLREVRNILDATTKPGGKRWLGVRIPCWPEMFDEMGIDLKAWREAGVDLFNLSGHYFTESQTTLSMFKREIPNGNFYPELHYAVASRPKTPEEASRPSVHRRTTAQQFYTAAHLAYARGAAGVSLFNFHYYRGTKNPNDVFGEPKEPPFEVLPKLRNPDWLATQPQHYAVAYTFRPAGCARPFLKPIVPQAPPEKLDVDLAPPKGGWKKGGRLRIQATESLAGSLWEVRLNGTKLEPTSDVSEPYENPYTTGIGSPEDYQAWSVPHGVLLDGVNRIELVLRKSSKPLWVWYLDLAVE